MGMTEDRRGPVLQHFVEGVNPMLQAGLWYSAPITAPVWAMPRPRKEQSVMICRGVRGATSVPANTREAILRETRRLLALMIRLNDIKPEDVASVIFTTTRDLNAEYPALAARQLGWLDIALLCGHEMDVPNSLPQCVRILVHWNTTKIAPGDQARLHRRSGKSAPGQGRPAAR